MAGIRDIIIERDNQDTYKKVQIYFGEHHGVTIEEKDGTTVFSLVFTHHGFQADASGVPSELEGIINEVRERYPENQID